MNDFKVFVGAHVPDCGQPFAVMARFEMAGAPIQEYFAFLAGPRETRLTGKRLTLPRGEETTDHLVRFMAADTLQRIVEEQSDATRSPERAVALEDRTAEEPLRFVRMTEHGRHVLARIADATRSPALRDHLTTLLNDGGIEVQDIFPD